MDGKSCNSAAKMETDVFIVDSITAMPGQARAVLDAYMSAYVPGATKRGMTLLHSWVSPPLPLKGDRANTLTFIWSVPGISGWWQMRLGAAFDPSVEAFWSALAPLILERSRNFRDDASRHV
jgi:hypothetical protein